ncbi:MAG TPA: 30S ribosomal protein S17 [Thermoanaerobaculia bacterium]|nr:30S ribosomal protein S17 [Thermoanaerobaculia bacterium]
MAEKTTTKKTTATKATTAKKTTAAKATAAKKTTAAKAAAPAKAATAAAVAARKAVTVRKRTAATVAHTATPAGETATGWRRFRRKTKVGVVISAKQPKTVIVTVGRMREHPLYKKVIRLRKGFAAHDEAGDVREGDLVRIQESRPYSATKRWKVVEVLSRSGEAGAAAPRVADIERQLEEAEGVNEILSKPASEREDAQESEADTK